jgi:hypothetical protein
VAISIPSQRRHIHLWIITIGWTLLVLLFSYSAIIHSFELISSRRQEAPHNDIFAAFVGQPKIYSSSFENVFETNRRKFPQDDSLEGYVIRNVVKDLLVAHTFEEKEDPSLRSG